MKAIIIAPALALLAAGCQPAGGPHGGGFPPPVVNTIVVERRDVPVTYEYVAQTAGYFSARAFRLARPVSKSLPTILSILKKLCMTFAR